MKNLIGLLSLALTTVGTSQSVSAEDAAKPSQGAYVVIVGVGETSDGKIQARPTAVADAKAFYELFSNKKYFDVKPDRIVLLTSDKSPNSQTATKENILTAVKTAVEKTGIDDPIIIAMFGRGASSGDATVFFSTDSSFKNRAKDAVLGTDLEVELKQAKSQKLALFLDIHFKGYDAGGESVVEPNLRDILAGVFGGEEKAEQPMPKDRLLMLSTIPTYDPLIKGNNGLFASTLVEALKGAADIEGYEPDGLVTVDELVKYSEKELADQARILGKTEKEKEAIPYIVGEEFSHFPITKNPKVTPMVTSEIAKLKDLFQASKIDAEVYAEGLKLLSRMPKLKNDQDLRRKYQELTDPKLPLGVAKFLEARAVIVKKTVLVEEEAELFCDKVLTAVQLVETRYVKVTNPGDLVAAAVKGLYSRLEVELPKEINEQLKGSQEWQRPTMFDVLKKGRLNLGKREDLSDNKDADIAITMMLASLNDPYTTYYDKDTIKKEESRLRGAFSGVGIQIRRDLVNDALLVVSPIKGSPAYNAGIMAGDLIVGIKRDSDPEGNPLNPGDKTEFSTQGMKTEEALDIILGKAGVPITLVIKQKGQTEPKDFTIRRGRVSVETLLGVKRDNNDDWNFYIDEKSKIVYMQMTQFAPSTFRDIAIALSQLKSDGMKGLILDLRFNPGGVLGGAVLISDLFIQDGKVVTVRPRVGRPEVQRDQGAGAYTDFPMAVLINGNSASASEIVSACLQDYGRAVIIGERTYGKGSVQQIAPFTPTEGQIKMTTARYFPPSDRNIDKLSTDGKPEDEWGVKPDIGYEVKLTREEQRELAEHFRDREIIPRKGDTTKKKEIVDKQLDKALEYIKKQIDLKK